MIILDACVIISHFAGDTHAVCARRILQTGDDLAIHPLTLAECAVAPAKAHKLPTFKQAVARLGLTVWDPDIDHHFRVAHLRATTPLKIPDCCVLDAAQCLDATLATFDTALAKTARALGLTVNEG